MYQYPVVYEIRLLAFAFQLVLCFCETALTQSNTPINFEGTLTCLINGQGLIKGQGLNFPKF